MIDFITNLPTLPLSIAGALLGLLYGALDWRKAEQRQGPFSTLSPSLKTFFAFLLAIIFGFSLLLLGNANPVGFKVIVTLTSVCIGYFFSGKLTLFGKKNKLITQHEAGKEEKARIEARRKKYGCGLILDDEPEDE